MAERIIKVGIMDQAAMREYTLKIARGELKPAPDAPKIFFPSIRAFAEALNDESQMLLVAIREHQPDTIAALAGIVHREPANVSRALKRLEQYGIVRLEETNKGNSKKPVALYDRLMLDLPLAC